MYLLTRSKWIGKWGKVLITNKDTTLVTAPHVLCVDGVQPHAVSPDSTDMAGRTPTWTGSGPCARIP